VDPVGDFLAINQELALFNPKLANKTQVVVVNKIDIPSVRERLNSTIAALRKVAGHSRVTGISAITTENVQPTFFKTYKLIPKLPPYDPLDLYNEADEMISFESQGNSRQSFQIIVHEENKGVSYEEEEDPTADNDDKDDDDKEKDNEIHGRKFLIVGEEIEQVSFSAPYCLFVFSLACWSVA
jgi:hypothetical protein